MPESAYDLPYTISSVIKLREMLDGFLELPKDKRPPEDVWFKPEELEEWLDRAFSSDKQTSFDFVIDDIEG